MTITYPLLTVIDDAGTVVTGATVAITSVKDKAGNDIASPGATLSSSGANVSVDYDAATKGEAWIVLSISKVGSTFTGLNAAPAFFLSLDPGRIAAPTGVSLAPNGLDPIVVETGVNARQALALIGAATAGKASGLDTSTAVYYAMGPSGTTTPRITATTDAVGNRTATTLSPPA